jgi:hypothetical protein
VCQLFPHAGGNLKNGLTSPFCWVFSLLPAGWAVIFAQETPMLVLALAAMIGAYSCVYARLSQFKWKTFPHKKI